MSAPQHNMAGSSATVHGITVNGVVITPDQVNAEMQYHPAPALPDARYQAAQALVVRELLLQRAVQLGIQRDDPGEAVERLLEQEINTPEPTETECRRYYENNKTRFHTSPLVEAAHILYLAPPEDTEARTHARERAVAALNELKVRPDLFESLALRDSACPSKAQGGRLGQISRHQTLPPFESALLGMREGELSSSPVATEVGYHIIRVDRRCEGALLPYDSVASWIADHLRTQSWRRGLSQYIQVLAGEAVLTGFALKAADSPLVQ